MPDKGAEDLVWNALGHLRDSQPVAEARAFIDRYAARRAWWHNLFSELSGFLWPRGVVASACAAVALALFIMLSPQPEPQTIATAIGQRKTVALADGSKLMLDTDTRLKVTFDSGERRLELLKGRANFAVAHDASRPFRVTAGGMTVTAIGTNFDVAALSGIHAVTLVSGKVAVEMEPRSNGPVEERVVLSPGQRLEVGRDGRLGRPESIDLKGILAWQQGRIEFDNATVEEAIAEANRYSQTKIRLAHRPSAGRHIDGVFRTDRIDAVAAALCAYLDLKVVARSEREIVLDRAG